MSSSATALPASAAHLRIDKTLQLCLFDDARSLIGSVSLLNEMVTVMFLEEEGHGVRYVVTADRQEPSQTYAVHLPIELPGPESNYYDHEDGENHRYTDRWYFNVGFHKDPTGARTGMLEGIGVVDIADISILPDPTARQRPGGCLAWLWNLLFRKKNKPQPSPKGLLGIPGHFPSSESLQMKVRMHFHLNADRVVEGANHIRMGIFLGRETPDALERTYLSINANPLLVGLLAEPFLPG